MQFAPLFGHQYSQIWIDFRGVRDAYMRGKGIDYFENSRRAALSQRAYATANPNQWRGYDADVWGLSASDGPLDSTLTVDGHRRQFHTYWARGAAAGETRDDGTIAPTAAGGSIAFAPEIVVPALRTMRARYGAPLFGQYGFVDAFNPTLLAHRCAASSRPHHRRSRLVRHRLPRHRPGPHLAMAENWRTGMIWRLLRDNRRRRARNVPRWIRRRMAGGALLIRRACAVPALLALVRAWRLRQGGRSRSARELNVWAFGVEGENMEKMVRDFERANPDIRVRVQQIPWTAAHEKLLTAFVGGALPDVAQLGNTWIPEFAALRALAPLDAIARARLGTHAARRLLRRRARHQRCR